MTARRLSLPTHSAALVAIVALTIAAAMFGKLMASEVGGVSVQMIDPVQARIYQAQPDGSLRVLATRNGISEIAVLRDTMGQRVEAIQLDHHAARIRVISDQGSRCYDSHSLRLLSHCEGALAWMP